jgi:hypothetical protein
MSPPYAIIRHDEAGTCTLGGTNMDGGPAPHLPDSVGDSRPAKGVAGNDSTDPRIVNCCAPYPVNFVEPCALWCQYDPSIWHATRPELFSCLEAQGVHANTRVLWYSGKPWWQDKLIPRDWQDGIHPGGFLAIALVLCLVVGGVAYSLVRWRRKVWWRRTLAEIMPSAIAAEREAAALECAKVRLPDDSK